MTTWKITSVDRLLTLVNSTFVHDHSSSPSWPALDHGIQLLADMAID